MNPAAKARKIKKMMKSGKAAGEGMTAGIEGMIKRKCASTDGCQLLVFLYFDQKKRTHLRLRYQRRWS
jgi:hypothetical protein